jgi:hypothetical protein
MQDLDFIASTTHRPKSAPVIAILPLDEDIEAAERLRTGSIQPAIETGSGLVLDFSGIRAPSQGFIHALLHDAFRVQESLKLLSFVNCSPTTREVIKAVATYASRR